MKPCQCRLASDYDLDSSEASPHRKLLCACLDRALRDLDPKADPLIRKEAIAWLEGIAPAAEEERRTGAISFFTVRANIVYTPKLDRLIKELITIAKQYEETGTMPENCIWYTLFKRGLA